MQPVQSGIRIDAELVGQPFPQFTIDTQCVGLAAAAIKGGHPLPA